MNTSHWAHRSPLSSGLSHDKSSKRFRASDLQDTMADRMQLESVTWLVVVIFRFKTFTFTDADLHQRHSTHWQRTKKTWTGDITHPFWTCSFFRLLHEFFAEEFVWLWTKCESICSPSLLWSPFMHSACDSCCSRCIHEWSSKWTLFLPLLLTFEEIDSRGSESNALEKVSQNNVALHGMNYKRI